MLLYWHRFKYNEECINWADVIVPTGGDGTFLLAASRIRDNKTPVVGFNSDPSRSEGHLCLPKEYSVDIREAIRRLQLVRIIYVQRLKICNHHEIL